MAEFVKPSYYRSADGKLTAMDVIDAFGLDFREGSILKYLVRWRKKDGLADLRKIRTYTQMIIDHEQVLADARDEVVDAEIRCDGEIGIGCVNGPADHEFSETCRPVDESLPAPPLSPEWQIRADAGRQREAVRSAVESVFPRVAARQRDDLCEALLQQLGEMQVRPPGQE